MQEVQENLGKLEMRKKNAKKLVRMHTDEVDRLLEFKKVKVTRQASHLANPSDPAHTGMPVHSINRRNPYHAHGPTSAI